MLQYEITVKGRVQGVGFRQFAKEKARDHSIKGWVKNMPDGTVQAVAQGEEKDLETFIDYLKTGPSMARVNNLSKYKTNNLSDFDKFSVNY